MDNVERDAMCLGLKGTATDRICCRGMVDSVSRALCGYCVS